MHNDRGPISTRFVRLSLRATVTPISGGNPPGKSGDREKSLSSRIGGSPFRFHARTSHWWDAGYETERDRERESFSLVAVTAMFQRISTLRGARSLPCVIDVTARRSFLSFASTVFSPSFFRSYPLHREYTTRRRIDEYVHTEPLESNSRLTTVAITAW